MTLNQQVNSLFLWWKDNLEILSASFKDHGSYDFPWPKVDIDISYDDAAFTANSITKAYSQDSIECCLNDLLVKLDSSLGLDYFFVRMHILGHLYLVDLNLELDTDDIHDVEIIEITTLMFAAIACHYFYKIKTFSPDMAQEILFAFKDQLHIERNYGRKYENDYRLDICQKLLTRLLRETSNKLH